MYGATLQNPTFTPALAAAHRMEADYARRYRDLWQHHWWWRGRRAVIEDEISTLAQANRFDQILDIGCGDGMFFRFLGQFGEVHGIESDPRIVTGNRARRQIEITPFDGSYESERRYNLILMLDVLEHIDDDLSAVRRAFELLQPGGILVLTVPAIQRLWSHHDVVNGHFRRYSRPQLNWVLQQNKFRVLASRYLFSWMVAPLFMRRFLYPARESADQSNYCVRASGRGLFSRIPEFLCSFERRLSRRVSLPLGTSCLAICQKPSAVD